MVAGTFISLWHFADRDLDVWLPTARDALAVLASHAGFVEAHVGHSADEPGACFVHTTWQDVGSYRRAVSSAESKLRVWPWLADMQHAASAFETLVAVDSSGVRIFDSSVDGA